MSEFSHKWRLSFRRILPQLFLPIDGASVAVFRVLFGLILIVEVYRYFSYGWIERYFAGTQFYFTYPGFSWVHPWASLTLMQLHFVVLGVCATLFAVGLSYRISAIGLFLTFSYVFLLDQAQYLNHFYLVLLASFLMMWIPAGSGWSLDAWMGGGMRSPSPFRLPAWSLWILRFQFGIVYVYGGIAKLTPDWLRGYPLSGWIRNEDHLPFIGPFMDERWMGLAMSYGGIATDLLVVPLLLYRRTRWVGFCVALVFNLLNDQMFSIGIFPWMMLAGTLLFFEPDWPRRLWNVCLQMAGIRQKIYEPSARGTGKYALLSKITTRQMYVSIALALFVAWQLLFPLRHFLYPGSVHWTEEGHMFSWHMKLRSKSGIISFHLRSPDANVSWEIDPHEYLSERQVDKMAVRPDMILQFSHFLRDEYRAQGYTDIEVYADARTSLNGRPMQQLVHPEINLAKVEWSVFPAKWILPLTTVLRPSSL